MEGGGLEIQGDVVVFARDKSEELNHMVSKGGTLLSRTNMRIQTATFTVRTDVRHGGKDRAGEQERCNNGKEMQ